MMEERGGSDVRKVNAGGLQRPEKKQENGFSSEGTKHTDTLNLDFCPPEL